jgi:hypothetical protein
VIRHRNLITVVVASAAAVAGVLFLSQDTSTLRIQSPLAARAFEDDLTRSKTWSAEEWKRRPLYEKTQETFWALLAEIF